MCLLLEDNFYVWSNPGFVVGEAPYSLGQDTEADVVPLSSV